MRIGARFFPAQIVAGPAEKGAKAAVLRTLTDAPVLNQRSGRPQVRGNNVGPDECCTYGEKDAFWV